MPKTEKIKKRIKIFKSPWHTAHDHDMISALSSIADFDLLINYTRRWDDKNRTIPENCRWVTHYEKGRYDLVILNIDQQCSNPRLNKSVLTKQMKMAVRSIDPDVPIIFINHGTPVYPENYSDGNRKNNYVSEQLKKEILDIISPDFMVINSHEAKENWNYEKSRTIIHGMNEKEWNYSEDREIRSCTFITPAGIGDKYYNRSFLVAVMEELKDRYGISHQWIGQPGCFSPKGIKEYKEFIGKSLIYFNPTYASPMPRSRTEAMISGCCIVTTPQHDADKFIKDGENGFLVPHDNVQYASEVISRLMDHPKITAEIGRNGRNTALKLFNRDRYREDWIKLLIDLNILN